MRDFDSIREQSMSSIENRIRHVYNQGYAKGYDDGLKSFRTIFDQYSVSEIMAIIKEYEENQ